MAGETLYEILGVDPKSSHEQIEKAYKEAEEKYGPDDTGEASDKEKWESIELAKEVLLDPKERVLYDEGLKNIEKAKGSYKEVQDSMKAELPEVEEDIKDAKKMNDSLEQVHKVQQNFRKKADTLKYNIEDLDLENQTRASSRALKRKAETDLAHFKRWDEDAKKFADRVNGSIEDHAKVLVKNKELSAEFGKKASSKARKLFEEMETRQKKDTEKAKAMVQGAEGVAKNVTGTAKDVAGKATEESEKAKREMANMMKKIQAWSGLKRYYNKGKEGYQIISRGAKKYKAQTGLELKKKYRKVVRRHPGVDKAITDVKKVINKVLTRIRSGVSETKGKFTDRFGKGRKREGPSITLPG